MPQFKNEDEFREWLEGKPREWAVVLAARAAARVLPIGTKQRTNKEILRREQIFLPPIRAISVSSTVGKYNAFKEVMVIANAASAAAFIAGSIVSYSAAYAIDAVTSADVAAAADAAYTASAAAVEAAVANTPHPASMAAKAAARGMWAAISFDANLLEQGQPANVVAAKRLWPGDPASWVAIEWGGLRNQLEGVEENWDVWIDWYERLLWGSSAHNVPEAALEIDLAYVLIEYDDWEKGPVFVNALIKARIEEIRERYAKDENREEIPPLKPAAIEPEWYGGRLVPGQPPPGDLSEVDLVGALVALGDVIAALARQAEETGQTDQRFVDRLRRVAGGFGERLPSQSELFKIAHALEGLARYGKTVDAEWPNHLAADYAAMLLQYERTLRQFPVWRSFLANARDEPPLSAEQRAEASDVARNLADALSADDASEFVDPTIPETLRDLADDLEEQVKERGHPDYDHLIAEGAELLALDLLESVSNVLKRLVEVALAGARRGKDASKFAGRVAGIYGSALIKALPEQAEKIGKEDAGKTIKWVRGFVVGGAGAGFGAYLTGLPATFPQVFAWLERVIEVLSMI